MSRSRQACRRALAAGRAAALAAAPAVALVVAMAATGGALAATGSAPAADGDIRDIRVPQPQAATWLVPALAVAALLCIVALALLWRRRVRRRMLSPSALALQQLERAYALMRQGTPVTFCVETSGIVRRYVEQAFHVAATDRTTEEFLQSLAQSSHAGLLRHRARLAEFLEACDLVKFSGLTPPPQLLESVYQGARAFVQESTAEADDALSAA